METSGKFYTFLIIIIRYREYMIETERNSLIKKKRLRFIFNLRESFTFLEGEKRKKNLSRYASNRIFG